MLRDFGIVTVVDLTVSLLGVMIVLPAALVWAEEHGPFRLRDLDPRRPLRGAMRQAACRAAASCGPRAPQPCLRTASATSAPSRAAGRPSGSPSWTSSTPTAERAAQPGPPPRPRGRYMWVVGVAFVIVVAVAGLNAVRHSGGGLRGPAVGSTLPEFAAALASGS